MCVTVTKYQNSINRLQQDIYPSLQQAFNTLLTENKNPLADIDNTFSWAQKEFQSLESFEEQIVFPAVLQLFDETGNEKDIVPNIPAIIRLSSIKEEILTEIMDQIAAMAPYSEILASTKNKDNVVDDNLQELINIFYKRFLPAKQFWKQLLIPLQNGAAKCNNRLAGKCQCNQNNIHKTPSSKSQI